MTRPATTFSKSRFRRAVRWFAMEVIARLLFYSGVLYAIALGRRFFGCRRLIIPMYHRVSAAGATHEGAIVEMELGVPADRFREQLRVMAWFGRFVTLDEGLCHVRSPGRGTVIAITFDDGYRDNLEHALPVLARHGAPATVFPVVRSADGGRPLWWDELSYVLRGSAMDGATWQACCEAAPELRARHDARTDLGASRPALAGFLSDRLLPLPARRRDELLELLRARLAPAPEPPSRLYLDWGELRAMAHQGWEIGGHTIDHAVLTAEPAALSDEQIRESKRRLERELGSPVPSFAYPNNGFNDSVCGQVEYAGYRQAVTVEQGVNYFETDRYRLRRVPIGAERGFQLALKLALYGWVYR
jgi:peptidoglycan/xylan/chitin deacetylase (PgdA/CDA1 family)